MDRENDQGAAVAPASVSDSNLKTTWLARLIAPLRHIRARPGRFVLISGAIFFIAFGTWVLSWRAYGMHHLSEGKRTLQADHFQEALRHFQIALTIWPGDAETLLLAARAARRMGNLDIADQHLTECEASQVLVEQAAFERVLLRATRGEVDAVGALCQAWLQQDHPDTPLILEALAYGEMTLLRFGAASAYLDVWLHRAPDHPQALYMKGRLEFLASNNQEALALLRRVAELDPERDDARMLLAGLQLDLGQAQEAVPHLEAIRSRQPNNVLVQARLAQGLLLLGRQDEAIALLDTLLQQQPEPALALLERGKVALRDGELAKAEEWLRKACKREPGNRAAHYQLLQCVKRRGKAEEARDLQRRLDQIDQESVRMREIVTNLLPKRRFDPDLHAEIGELYLNVGAVDEGVAWLNRALAVNPRHVAAHRALARYYQELGQSGRAQYHRDIAGDPHPGASVPKK